MNEIINHETTSIIMGVPCQRYPIVADTVTGRIVNQIVKTQPREFTRAGHKYRITAELRFDDSCRNGHESFLITVTTAHFNRGSWRDHASGCIHDEILIHFPELSALIKWHLTSTDGPMHYLANTAYLASDRDHNGLRVREEKPLLTGGKPGAFNWYISAILDGKPIKALPTLMSGAEKPTGVFSAVWMKHMIKGTGKARELEAARSAAVWLDATDEELSADKAELTAALLARLPGLLAAFRADMLGAGLTWPSK